MRFPGESQGILDPPSKWSAPSSPPSRSARACRSTRSRPPRCTRRSPTTVSGWQPSLVAGTAGPDGTFTSGVPRPTQVGESARTAAPRSAHMLESVVSDQGTAPMARSRVPGRRQDRDGQPDRPTCSCYRGYTASSSVSRRPTTPTGRVRDPAEPQERPLRRPAGGPVFRRDVVRPADPRHPPDRYDATPDAPGRTVTRVASRRARS